MAQTGYTPIYLYYSSTTTNAPSAGNLGYGELAINITDKNLFFKDNTNTVNTVPIRQSSGSSNGWLSSTDWTTFNSKQPAGTYVTSVGGTSPVASSGGTTPSISLASGYGDTQNPYASKTANYILAAPNGSSGVPTFRAIVAADVPTLNQNTTGAAGSLTATATGGALQINGPSTTRLMSTPDANFTVARTDAGQTFSGTQTFAGANIYNEISNTGSPGSNASPSYSGTKYYGYAGRQIAQTDGGDCSGSSYRGVYRIQTCNDGDATLVTRMQFNGSSDITVSTVNMKFDSGYGIDFSATAGTGTSELLADYEEGTWTPTLSFTSGSVTYNAQNGTYTKVGNVVTINFWIYGNTVSSPAGDCYITGLPYATGGTQTRPACILRVSNITITGQMSMWAGTSSSQFVLNITNNGSTSAFNAGSLGANFELDASISYIVA